jgi:hypothetical protein
VSLSAGAEQAGAAERADCMRRPVRTELPGCRAECVRAEFLAGDSISDAFERETLLLGVPVLVVPSMECAVWPSIMRNESVVQILDISRERKAI